jgi:hypothetical protein
MAVLSILSTLLIAAALLLTPVSAELCFSAILTHTVCLSWTIAAPNITFTMTCSALGLIDRTGWCAVGLPLIAGSTAMAPAEIFWLSILENGTPSFEDRFTARGHDSPTCVKQLSHVLSVSQSGGGITASWTRPLELAPTPVGFTNITLGTTTSVIAAWSSDLIRPTTQCAGGWPEHVFKWKGNANF